MPLFYQLQGNFLAAGATGLLVNTPITAYNVAGNTIPTEELTFLNGAVPTLLQSGTTIQFGATATGQYGTGALTLTDFSAGLPTDGTFIYTAPGDYTDPLLLAAFNGQASISLPCELRFKAPGATYWTRSTNPVTLNVSAPVLNQTDATPFATTAALAALTAQVTALVTAFNGGSTIKAAASIGDGASTSLEAIPTAGVVPPAVCSVYLVGTGKTQFWTLVPSVAASVQGTIQEPLDYNATTNDKVWFLAFSN